MRFKTNVVRFPQASSMRRSQRRLASRWGAILGGVLIAASAPAPYWTVCCLCLFPQSPCQCHTALLVSRPAWPMEPVLKRLGERRASNIEGVKAYNRPTRRRRDGDGLGAHHLSNPQIRIASQPGI